LKLGAELDSTNKIIIQVRKLSTHVLSKISLHTVVICCLYCDSITEEHDLQAFRSARVYI